MATLASSRSSDSHRTEVLGRRLIVSRSLPCVGLIRRWVRFAKVYSLVARERLVVTGNYRGPGTDEAPGARVERLPKHEKSHDGCGPSVHSSSRPLTFTSILTGAGTASPPRRRCKRSISFIVCSS